MWFHEIFHIFFQIFFSSFEQKMSCLAQKWIFVNKSQNLLKLRGTSMGVSTHSGPWMGAAQAAGTGSDDAGKKYYVKLKV